MHPHIPRPRRKATRTCTDTAGVVRTVHGEFMWPFTARVNEKAAPIERIAAVAICRRLPPRCASQKNRIEYPREVVEERSADHRRRWSTGLDATSRSRRSLICDCRGQDAHRWRDAVLRRGGEAQHEAALARAADVVRREGRRMDLAFERVPARRYVVGTKLEPRDNQSAL